jgi:ribonuclease J
MTSITIYDGAESIGGNKIYVEEGGRGVFLDFGMNFGRTGQFFSEFLQNRTNRGINDSIELGIIPKLNIYRNDLIPANIDASHYPSLNVEAVLISHAHMDHCGEIGVLNEAIPLVASPTSIAIIKGMQDTAGSSYGRDTVYFTKKELMDNGLQFTTGGDYRCCRNFYATTPPPDDLKEFMATKPGEKTAKKKLKAGILASHKDLNLPFDVTAYDVDHSIFGASAYLLKGETTLAYSGDLRLHGNLGNETKKFVSAAKEASVLIMEGTRTSRKPGDGDDENITEKSVSGTCSDAVDAARGLVIADFAPRNFERFESFRRIAKKTGRKLVATAKDMYMFHAMGCAGNECGLNDLGIYYELKDRKGLKWETEVVMGEMANQYITPDQIAKNPSGYILCFSLNELKNLLDIQPDGGTYIYSSCEAFSEEMEFDFKRLWNWLTYMNFDVKGFAIGKKGDISKPVFDASYHASGHASLTDLAWIIDQIDPDVIVPVHTENPAWFSENWENTRVVKDGERVEF